MKDAILTIRLSARTRRRLETAARHEGRSLSGQAERLIEQGLGAAAGAGRAPQGVRSLAGVFAGAAVPTLADFREVRALLTASLRRRTRDRAQRRR